MVTILAGLTQGPCDVLAHQFSGMTESLAQGNAQRVRLLFAAIARQGVAHGHRQVAQPALMANAANRRAFGMAEKLGLTPAEQLDQAR